MSIAKTLFLLFGGAYALALAAAEFDLPALERLALWENRAVQAARGQVDVARAGVEGAAAFPNPELEVLGGTLRPRVPGATSGASRSLTLTQPLDLPGRRGARIAAAQAGQAASEAGLQAFQVDLLAQLRLRYFEVLRRQAELRNAREDASLMEGVRSRIARRVELGDAARFELLKAEAENLNAQKAVQAATFRVAQARSQLRQLAGQALPEGFSLSGNLLGIPALPPLARVRQELLAGNPELLRARAETERAGHQLDLERQLRWPSLALKASVDQDPEVRDNRLGVVVTLPLWDRRQGPVGEASAQLARARDTLAAQEFAVQQALETAYHGYEIARTQVAALESGIVRQAEAALKVAEAAYRFGERGFLEVIDAQRVYRAARAELIGARYELAAAWVDVERLRAQPVGTSE